jgi:hypothetical protein
MPTTKLNVGVNSLVQNQIYALPSIRVMAFTDGAAPTLQQSSDLAFTANVAVTLTGGQAELNGGFLKMTSATPINLVLKRY